MLDIKTIESIFLIIWMLIFPRFDLKMNVTVVTSEELTTLPVSVLATKPRYMGIVSAVELFFGLIFHILAVLAIRKAKKLWRENNHSSVPHFLFNALRIIDFCAVIFFLLRGFVSPFQQLSVFFHCEFGISTNLFFTIASGLANVAMCMERCIALLAPFSYRNHVTLFKAKMTIAMAVIIALIFSILPLIGLSSYTYENDGVIVCVAPGDISYDVDFILVHSVMFFIIGFSIVLCIFFCNLIVVYYILKLNRSIVPVGAVGKIPEITTGQNEVEDTSQTNGASDNAPNTNPGEETCQVEEAKAPELDSRNSRKHDVQLAIMFIVVSVIYTISWLPLQVSVPPKQ